MLFIWRDRNGELRNTSALRIPVLLFLPALILLLSQYITIQSMGETLWWFAAHPASAGKGWLVLVLFLLLLYGATGNLFWASALQTVVCVILSFVSFYENMVNGVPLRVSDFFMVKAAGSLIGFLKELRPTGPGVAAVTVSILLLVLLRKINSGCKKLKGTSRAVMGIGALALILLVTLPQIKTVPLWEQEETVAESYERQGFLLGLYDGIAPTVPRPPEGYGQERMEKLLAEIGRDAAPAAERADGVKPTVIFFMSESFFDVTRLPNVEFSADPVPIYHALARKNTSGTFYSNTYGGGTGNVEMEVFTGLSSFMLGIHVTPTTMNPELYDTLPSLVKLLKGQGYQTAAVHSYTDELYNRAETFPAIGFDELYFEDSFPESAERKGGYLSDSALVDQAISVYEQRDQSRPMFLYVLSMENHQPYPVDKFVYNSGIGAKGMGLTEEEQGILDTIVTGIHDADASLGKMIRYFSGREEPVMLVFWGDHLPSLYTGSESGTVYTSLDFVGADDLEGLTEEELKEMVSTNYLIWTNYEKEPLPDRDTSSMMLGVQVLDRLGCDRTPFFDYVSYLEKDMLLYREKLFLAADGTPSREIPEKLMPEIERYGAVLYDMLYGEQHITARMNELP